MVNFEDLRPDVVSIEKSLQFIKALDQLLVEVNLKQKAACDSRTRVAKIDLDDGRTIDQKFSGNRFDDIDDAIYLSMRELSDTSVITDREFLDHIGDNIYRAERKAVTLYIAYTWTIIPIERIRRIQLAPQENV
jgi:hypothetical protein